VLQSLLNNAAEAVTESAVLQRIIAEDDCTILIMHWLTAPRPYPLPHPAQLLVGEQGHRRVYVRSISVEMLTTIIKIVQSHLRKQALTRSVHRCYLSHPTTCHCYIEKIKIGAGALQEVTPRRYAHRSNPPPPYQDGTDLPFLSAAQRLT